MLPKAVDPSTSDLGGAETTTKRTTVGNVCPSCLGPGRFPFSRPLSRGRCRLGLGAPKGFSGEGRAPFLLSPGRRKEGNAICCLNTWPHKRLLPTSCLSYTMETQALKHSSGPAALQEAPLSLKGPPYKAVRLSLNTPGLPPFNQPRPFSGLERELPSSSRRILIREEKAIGGEGEVPGTSPHSSS